MAATAAFSTDGLPANTRTDGWTRAVCRSYFPLDLEYRAADSFRGTLQIWGLGAVQASRLRSEATMYRRRRQHLTQAGEEEFLLTIPRSSPVRFLQMGREVVCPPGGFILERGNEPYEFSYGATNDLIVAKFSHGELADRLGDPGRFCAIEFDASRGIAAVMVDLLRSSGAYSDGLSQAAKGQIGHQLVDLLALAMEQDPRSPTVAETSVRLAHLRRITETVERLKRDPDLSPARVAATCGISTRYLHDLCRNDGLSFGERLREARLTEARSAFLRRSETRSITEIAFACGFGDASSFSRAYRARYGETPRDTRAESRGA